MSSVASQLSGSPASPSKLWVARGQATIAATTQSIAVVDANITANSLVFASLGLDNGALATQDGMSVCLQPGVGFTLRSNAAAAGTGLKVNWAVLSYN